MAILLGQNPFAGASGIDVKKCLKADYRKIETDEYPYWIVTLCHNMLNFVCLYKNYLKFIYCLFNKFFYYLFINELPLLFIKIG
jgi:hypothetical protein